MTHTSSDIIWSQSLVLQLSALSWVKGLLLSSNKYPLINTAPARRPNALFPLQRLRGIAGPVLRLVRWGWRVWRRPQRPRRARVPERLLRSALPVPCEWVFVARLCWWASLDTDMRYATRSLGQPTNKRFVLSEPSVLLGFIFLHSFFEGRVIAQLADGIGGPIMRFTEHQLLYSFGKKQIF